MENQSEMQRVCAYCRVSTKAEKQDMSLQSQIQYFTDLIDNNPNYINMGVYAEKKSGGNQYRRSEFLKMIQECKNKNIDIIYTKTISRFGRSQIQLLRTLEELTKIGVRVIFELEDIDSLRDKQTIRTVIKSYFAEDELTRGSYATRFGIQRMFEKGKVKTSNPFPLFGYKYGKNRKLILVPEDAEIVKEIFDRYCNKEKPSVIAKSLNDRGIKTPSGKEWNTDILSRLLRQEKYMGVAYLQKTYCVDGKKVKNLGQRAMYVVSDYCEPIITEEKFEQVKKVRELNKKYDRKPGFVPEHDCFKGMIKCGQCGATYIKISNGHRCYPSGKQEKINYQCNVVRTTRMRDCRNKVQSRQALEDGFVKAFNTLKTTIKQQEKIPYHNEELNTIENRIRQLLDKEKIFILLEAREQMTASLQREYEELIDELLGLQDRKKEILRHNADIKLQNYHAENCEKCLEQNELTKFDEKVFATMIKDIKVMNKNRVLYNFKNGYIADVEIIDYYIQNDEIGEVKVYVSTKC